MKVGIYRNNFTRPALVVSDRDAQRGSCIRNTGVGDTATVHEDHERPINRR